MKVKDKGPLWDFLKQKASQKLQQEQNFLGQLEAEINSIELSPEKMSEMRDQYMDGLNPRSQKMLPANRVRLVQTFIARLDEAAQMAKKQKGRLEEQSATIKTKVTEHRVEEQKYLTLFEKNRAALLQNENVLEQKLSDQLTQSRWFRAKEKSFPG